jgi:hypothetical protein
VRKSPCNRVTNGTVGSLSVGHAEHGTSSAESTYLVTEHHSSAGVIQKSEMFANSGLFSSSIFGAHCMEAG